MRMQKIQLIHGKGETVRNTIIRTVRGYSKNAIGQATKMSYMSKMTWLILTLAFVLIGCKSAPEIRQTTIIRDTVYKVVPKPIIDSGKVKAVRIEGESILQHLRTRGNDTVVRIEYRPSKQMIKWRIKPDTVQVNVRDTITKYQVKDAPTIQKDSGFTAENIKAILALLVVLLILYGLIRGSK